MDGTIFYHNLVYIVLYALVVASALSFNEFINSYIREKSYNPRENFLFRRNITFFIIVITVLLISFAKFKFYGFTYNNGE